MIITPTPLLRVDEPVRGLADWRYVNGALD
jgi:hypothetical protein